MNFTALAFGVAASVATSVPPGPSPECQAAVILDRLWTSSYSQVDQTIAEYDCGATVNLGRLGNRVRLLVDISGIQAEGNYFGYFPDDHLKATMGEWRRWHDRMAEHLCQRLPGSSSACVGQERLVNLWIDRTRALERIRQDIDAYRPMSDGDVVALGEFFQKVTGVPLPITSGFSNPVIAMFKLGQATDDWDRWFASHVGDLCEALAAGDAAPGLAVEGADGSPSPTRTPKPPA